MPNTWAPEQLWLNHIIVLGGASFDWLQCCATTPHATCCNNCRKTMPPQRLGSRVPFENFPSPLGLRKREFRCPRAGFALGIGTIVPVLLERKCTNNCWCICLERHLKRLGAGLCSHRNFALAIRWPRNSHGHSARTRSARSFTPSTIPQFVTSSPLSSGMIRRSPSMPTICAGLCSSRDLIVA